MNHYIFFDLETSLPAAKAIKGLGYIIQIAAVAVTMDMEVVEKFENKILFDIEKADQRILDLTGFDQSKWKSEGLPEDQVLNNFAMFVNKYVWFPSPYNDIHYSILAGHNIASFDLPVLFAWEERIKTINPDKKFHKIKTRFMPHIDTLNMALTWSFNNGLWFSSYKLKDLCEYFEIDTGKAHNALSDCIATVELTKKLKDKI